MRSHASVVSRLHDYLIPLTTPFAADMSVDHDSARHNVRHTLSIPGCGGVYFGSVYQEFWTMTTSERMALLDTVADEIGKRVPLVAGVSSTSLEQSVELAKAAITSGVDILMVWPPIWGPRDRKSVRRFFHEFAARVSHPMFIYSTTLSELGFYLEPSMIEELAREIPDICGVKEGSGNVSTFLSLTSSLGDRLAIGTPFEEYWGLAKQAYPDRAADFLLGSSRSMYMQSPQQPFLHNAVKLLRGNRLPEAFAELDKVRELVNMQMESFRHGEHPLAIVKYACSLLGQRGHDVRAPTPQLSEEGMRWVRSVLTKMQLI
jgi:4-hydroxy-tetrahydrodipicolinate synthase